MRPFIAVSALLALLCGCPGPQESTPLQGQRAPAEQSAWLNPDAVINSSYRLRAESGNDIRAAGYWSPEVGVTNAGDLRLIALLRDYSSRQEGRPDANRVLAYNIGSGESAVISVGDEGVPFELTVSPTHDHACVALFRDGSGSRARVGLVCYGYGDKPLSVAPQSALLPLRVDPGGRVLLRGIRQLEIEKGLVAASLDWQQQLQVLDVLQAAVTDLESAEYLPAPVGEAVAGYVAQFDPALPTAAIIRYSISGAQRSWELPYFVSSSSSYWRPDLVWGDSDSLVTLGYLRASRESRGQDVSGVFRIVSLDASSGDVRLLEDHVSSDTSLVADGGVIWYAMKSASGAAGTWEVWVSGPDGLAKSMLWSRPNTVFLEVLDCFEHRRVLLHRQYFMGDESPELVSELLELSLDRLTRAPTAEEVPRLEAPEFEVEAEGARQAREDSGESHDLFDGPPPADPLQPPIFIPDSPGGGGGGPPPIAP